MQNILCSAFPKELVGVRSREIKSLQDINKAGGSLTDQNLGQRIKMLLNTWLLLNEKF